MSRHVSAEIQAFRLASRGVGFGTALRRAANRVSVREGSVGGLTGQRFRPPRYRFVADRGALGKKTYPYSKSTLKKSSCGPDTAIDGPGPSRKYIGCPKIVYAIGLMNLSTMSPLMFPRSFSTVVANDV